MLSVDSYPWHNYTLFPILHCLLWLLHFISRDVFFIFFLLSSVRLELYSNLCLLVGYDSDCISMRNIIDFHNYLSDDHKTNIEQWGKTKTNNPHTLATKQQNPRNPKTK